MCTYSFAHPLMGERAYTREMFPPDDGLVNRPSHARYTRHNSARIPCPLLTLLIGLTQPRSVALLCQDCRHALHRFLRWRFTRGNALEVRRSLRYLVLGTRQLAIPRLLFVPPEGEAIIGCDVLFHLLPGVVPPLRLYASPAKSFQQRTEQRH